MLEHLAGDDHVGAPRRRGAAPARRPGPRPRRARGPAASRSATGRRPTCRWPRLRHVRGEQPAAAGDVDQQAARAGSRAGPAGRGPPRSSAASRTGPRLPPVGDQVVVLPRVVAGVAPATRHGHLSAARPRRRSHGRGASACCHSGGVSTSGRCCEPATRSRPLAVTGIAAPSPPGRRARARGSRAAFAAGQLATGWSNDWLDRARDAAQRAADKPLVQRRPAAAHPRRAAAGRAGRPACRCRCCSGRRAGAAHLAGGRLRAGVQRRAQARAAVVGAVRRVVRAAAQRRHAGRAGRPRPAPAWATGAAARCSGSGAHLANALPDLEDDLATGVRGLPHRLGRRRVDRRRRRAAARGHRAAGVRAGRPRRWAAARPRVAAALTAAGRRAAGGPARGRPSWPPSRVAVVDVALLVTRGARLGAGV